MAKGNAAIVTPSVLLWAREQIGFSPDTAAKKASVTEAALHKWEAGTEQPTLRQAHLLAAAYRVPFAAFFLEKPPEIRTRLPKDYRRFAGTLGGAVSPIINLDVREAWQKREIALELLTDQAQPSRPFALRASLNQDPEVVGRSIREQVGVTLDVQSTWRDSRRALNAWRSAIENLGVLVLQTGQISTEELRAYSLFAEPLPVIVLNRKDPPAARTFSLFHELTHLALHSEGLCDLTTEVDRSPEEQRLEVFCNAVAASSLIPGHALSNHPVVRQHGSDVIWSDSEIEELSKFFSVSREALLRRLLTLGRTTTAFYERKRREYQEEYKSPPKGGGFVPPAANALSLLGRSFVRLVLSSLDSRSITTSDAVDYLGVKVKHLPTLAASLKPE